MLQAAVEPGSLAGLVLTDSPFPWVRGALPHPAVMAGFAAYDAPGLGPLVLEARMRRIDAERAVRLGIPFTPPVRVRSPRRSSNSPSIR